MPTSFKESLEAWASQQLEVYVEQLSELPLLAAPKEFNDPVWGTILMRPAEVMILDSPLLQRLRTIAQLGVVHFVYPAARHSRLEHTLGVVHQVSRLIASLNEHYTGKGLAVNDQQRYLLRLTALCHDVGHGALSHVSENALATFEQIENIGLDFADREQVEQAALAEIASYYIVGSPAFRSLLKVYRHHKVRAIEAMVASFYHQLAAIEPSAVPMLAFNLRDSDFAGLDRERIAEVIGRPLSDADEPCVAVALDLAKRMGRRDLFVRVLARHATRSLPLRRRALCGPRASGAREWQRLRRAGQADRPRRGGDASGTCNLRP